MNVIKRLFEKTEFMLLLSIVLAFILSIDTSPIKIGIEISLGIIMFFSIRPFLSHKFHFKKHKKGITLSILINYFLLSAAFIGIGALLFPVSSDYFIGFLLLAIVPPAIAIVPFCFLSKCDLDVADPAIFISYLLSLLIIPISLFVVFGESFKICILIRVLLILIVLPVTLAYFTLNWKNKIFDFSKIINNLGLAFVVFVSVNMNKTILLRFSDIDVQKVYLGCVLVIFGLGVIVYEIAKRITNKPEAIDYTLYATQKNVGTSIVIAISLFSPNAALPGIVALIVQFVYFILMEEFFVKRNL